jgi:hypothetical protein
MSLDEALTLGKSVFQDLDGLVYDADVRGDDDVDCGAAKMQALVGRAPYLASQSASSPARF